MPVSVASDAGDISTQPLPPISPTAVLPPIPSPVLPRQPPPRSPSTLLWIAALILGIVVLLILDGMIGGAEPTVHANTPSAHRSATTSPRSPSRSPSPSPSPSPPAEQPPSTGSVDDAATALLGVIEELSASGAVDDHLAKDLQHGVDGITRALDDGDAGKTVDALGRLQDKVDKGLEHGEIAAEDAQRLNDAIEGLAAALNANGGEGD